MCVRVCVWGGGGGGGVGWGYGGLKSRLPRFVSSKRYTVVFRAVNT